MILGLAFAVEHHDILVGVEIVDLGGPEVQHGPARRIDRPPQDLGQAGPRQADFQHGLVEMQRGQPRRSQQSVLLLRVLQDHQRHPALHRCHTVANAQGHRLAASRAIRDFVGRCGRNGLRLV